MCLGQGGLNKSARVKLSAHIHSYAHIRDYHILRRRESSIYTCVGRVVLTLTPIFSYENNVSSGTGGSDVYKGHIPTANSVLDKYCNLRNVVPFHSGRFSISTVFPTCAPTPLP